MKNGLLKHKRQVYITKAEKDEAFKRYLKLFYKQPKIDYPEDILEKSDEFAVHVDDTYKPTTVREGFFEAEALNMELVQEQLKKTREEYDAVKEASKAKEKDLRNSYSLSLIEDKSKEPKHPKHSLSTCTTYTERLRVLKKIKLSAKTDPKSNIHSEKLSTIDASSEQYPDHVDARRNINKKIVRRIECQIATHYEAMPVAPDGFIPNSVVAALYKELERGKTEQEMTWKPKELTEEQLEELAAYERVCFYYVF